MGIDIDKMRARKEARAAERKGGDRIDFEEGQTLLLIHPPCAGLDEDDLTNGYPYLECVMHFDVGPDKRALASLQQPLLKHPAMVRAIAESFRPFDVEEVGDADPCALALEDGRLDKKESRAQPRFYWGATPMFHRNKDGEAWKPLTPKPGIIAGGIEIHGGLENAVSEIAENYNVDLTNFDGAVYVNVIKGKTGKGEKARTKYDVKFDPRSAKEPVVVAPELRELIETGSAEGGPLNLFRYCAGSFRSPAAVEAAIDGVDLDEEADAKPAKAGKAAPKPAARKSAVTAADDEAPNDDELDVVAGEGGEVEGEPASDEAVADTLYIDEEGYILVSDGGERAVDDNGDAILYQPDESDIVQEVAAEPEPPPPPPKPAPKAAPAKPVAAKPAAAAAKPVAAKPAPKPAAPSSDPDADLAAIDAEIDAAASRRPAVAAKPAATAAKPPPKPAAAAAKPAPKPAAPAPKPVAAKPSATVARVSTAAKPAAKPAVAAKPAARTVVRK